MEAISFRGNKERLPTPEGGSKDPSEGPEGQVRLSNHNQPQTPYAGEKGSLLSICRSTDSERRVENEDGY